MGAEDPAMIAFLTYKARWGSDTFLVGLEPLPSLVVPSTPDPDDAVGKVTGDVTDDVGDDVTCDVADDTPCGVTCDDDVELFLESGSSTLLWAIRVGRLLFGTLF